MGLFKIQTLLRTTDCHDTMLHQCNYLTLVISGPLSTQVTRSHDHVTTFYQPVTKLLLIRETSFMQIVLKLKEIKILQKLSSSIVSLKITYHFYLN